MASYCVSSTTVSSAVGNVIVPYFVFSGSTAVSPTASGCASNAIILDNAAYVQLQTIATTQAQPVTITWPEIFNLSVSDGATLSVAILAVWVSAFAYRTLRRVLNQDGEKE